MSCMGIEGNEEKFSNQHGEEENINPNFKECSEEKNIQFKGNY